MLSSGYLHIPYTTIPYTVYSRQEHEDREYYTIISMPLRVECGEDFPRPAWCTGDRGQSTVWLNASTASQVIAWEDKQTSASGSGSSGVMRYGVVIMGGSSEGGEGAGDDDEYAGDGRGSGRVGGGSGLRHVRVKLTPGRVDNLLSSQVSAY